MKSVLICPVCKKEFTSDQWKARFCSLECRLRERAQIANDNWANGKSRGEHMRKKK